MTEQTNTLTNTILNNGYRLTDSRQAIIEALVACEGHITADDLVDRVHQQAPHVGRMTVYRTLDLLCELGAIRPIYQGTGAAHYILMADGSHHHLICNQCHQVIEFDTCTVGDLIPQLAKKFDFQISGHLLELHGLCPTCQAA